MAYPSTVPGAALPWARLVNDEVVAVPMCTPVYSDSAGTFKKAIGDGSAKSKSIGIVVDPTVLPGAVGNVLTVGVVSATTAQWDAVAGTSGGLTYGTYYYLNTSVAGALTTSSLSAAPVLFGLGPTLAVIITKDGSSATTTTITNGDVVTLPIGTPVYASAAGAASRAIATSLATSTVIGVVGQAAGIAPGGQGILYGSDIFISETTAQWDAICDTSGGLAFGVTYYLSATTAGKLTATPPIGAGQYLEPVLVGISPTTAIVALGVPAAIGAAGTITGTGSTNNLTKYTGSATLGNGRMTDDGTAIVMPGGLDVPYTDLGTLGSVADLDLTGYDTSSFKFTPALGGTTIRSIKTKATAAGKGSGQLLWLFNAGNSTLPGDYLGIFTQDDGSALYNHIHLEGRQPWHSFPALSVVALRLDDATSKWHLAVPGDFAQHPRPIPITFSLPNGNSNDILPVDSTTGLNGRYAQWWRIIAGTTSRLCGIEASPPTGGSNWSRRILLMNYGAGPLVLANQNSSGGASAKPFFCPGGADISLPVFGSMWVILDEGNNAWIPETH